MVSHTRILLLLLGLLELFIISAGEKILEIPISRKKHIKKSHVKFRRSFWNRKEAILRTKVGYDYRLDSLFGSQRQSFEISVDTGSADLWIPSVECRDCFSENRFNCFMSETCSVNKRSSVVLGYADGDVNTYVCWDDIELTPGLLLKNQSFLLAYKTSGAIFYNTGILGLGLQALASNPEPTILTNLYRRGLIEHNAFSLYLTTQAEKSRMVFGGFNSEHVQPGSVPIYASIISRHSYLIYLDKVMIGTQNAKFRGNTLLVDSGNSMITFAERDSQQIFRVFTNNYGITCYLKRLSYAPSWSEVYCLSPTTNVYSAYPPIDFIINERNLTLYPQDYIEKCNIYHANQSALCLTKLEVDHGYNYNILGASFMHSFNTLFDLEANRIGFARSRDTNKIQYIHIRDGNHHMEIAKANKINEQSSLNSVKGIGNAGIDPKTVLPLLIALFSWLLITKLVLTRKNENMSRVKLCLYKVLEFSTLGGTFCLASTILNQ